MASDTRQMFARHAESTAPVDAEDHDACGTLVRPRARFWTRLESLGAGCRRVGTRFWVCVGRCNQVHSDDEYGTDFFEGQFAVGCVHIPTVPLFEQPCGNGVILPETLERIRPCQLEMQRAQTMTRCKSTLSRKVKRWVKANSTTRKEIARPARPTRALQTSTRARTVAELDIGRRTAGDQVEEHTTIPPVTTATRRKARVTRKAKEQASI